MKGFTRGHKEVTAAKGKEAAAELAATRRAATKKAIMSRYDEILERSKAQEVGFDKEDEKDMKEWEEIARLPGEAIEDGEEYFLV